MNRRKFLATVLGVSALPLLPRKAEGVIEWPGRPAYYGKCHTEATRILLENARKIAPYFHTSLPGDVSRGKGRVLKWKRY